MKKILNVSFEVKELDESGIFSGYGSVFGNIDEGRDMVAHGAFAKTLVAHAAAGTMPLMYYSHHSGKETGEWLEMHEDEYGLYCKGKLWIDGPHPDPDALKAYRGMKKEKAAMGLSIGYAIATGGSDYDRDANIHILKELDLWEVSPTPCPMNTLAVVGDVKEIKTVTDLEKHLRQAGDLSRTEAKRIVHVLKSSMRQACALEDVKQLIEKNITTLGG
jgi:HK97 family phage prohead protease